MINKLSPLNHPNQQIKFRIHNWQFTIINSFKFLKLFTQLSI